MAGSSTSEAPPSASATWPTTSPDPSSNPAASDPNYTLNCEEPGWSPSRRRSGVGVRALHDRSKFAHLLPCQLDYSRPCLGRVRQFPHRLHLRDV